MYSLTELCLCAVWICLIISKFDWFQTTVDESDTLRSLLTKKEAEMKEMEEKYKKYLEKAKTVSKDCWTLWLSQRVVSLQSETKKYINI